MKNMLCHIVILYNKKNTKSVQNIEQILMKVSITKKY